MTEKAVVFAGQGAQSVGMGKDLAEAYPECRALFDKADEVLGYGLSRICFEGPVEELTRSNHCQPAIFVASLACYRALQKEKPGLACRGMAGLSLGEWSALHAAGALTFEDTLRVLEARGRFMQEACDENPGTMLSVIGLPVAKLHEICAAAGVEIANLNSPEQTVLSGTREGIAAAGKLAAEAGAKKVIPLNVAGAFHSALMASAGQKLAAVLENVAFRAPTVPVVSNVTGRPHGAPADVRANMVKQVTQPVQWVSCIEWFKGAGVRTYIECGPGRVLTGLIKRIDAEAGLFGIQDQATLRKAVEGLV